MKIKEEKVLEEPAIMELSDDDLESVAGGKTSVFLYKKKNDGTFNYTSLSVDMDMSVDELMKQYHRGFPDIPKNVQIIHINKHGVPGYEFDSTAKLYQEQGYTLVER